MIPNQEFASHNEIRVQCLNEHPHLLDKELIERCSQSYLITTRGRSLVELGFNIPPTKLSEKERIIALQHFLKLAKRAAQEIKDQELVEEIIAVIDNMVYITHKDLIEAIEFFADDLVGKNRPVILLAPGERSERYMANKLIEAIKSKLSSFPISLVQSVPQALEKLKIKKEKKNATLVLIDDFALSGSRIRQKLEQIDNINGHTTLTADIQVYLIASGPFADSPLIEDINYTPQITAYFHAHSSPKLPFPSVVITGSHCSTDYGFESFIEKLISKLGIDKLGGKELISKLPIFIKRPYDKD